LDYGIFSAVQKAAETALQLPDIYIKQVQDRYQERRDFLIEGLGEMGWQITPSKATMYLWIPTPIGLNSTDFALDVLEKTGVVVTPGNAFGEGGEGYVRISLILDCDRLGEALARLKQAGISYDGDRSSSKSSNKSIAKIES
jgi:LL-diaminopimelate aminotransferase